MTATLISIISILIGILGANSIAVFSLKYSLGFIGNTILGVFGSAFLIKSIGRLGFGPKEIMESGTVDVSLLIINLLVSCLGGMLLVLCIKTVKNKIDKT
ncbi:MAG: hypothetical protein JKY08_02220 [Flavobacteriaceae bacterium]|nr:hypothetical protein [Flavobacteriaceae bacterium]